MGIGLGNTLDQLYELEEIKEDLKNQKKPSGSYLLSLAQSLLDHCKTRLSPSSAILKAAEQCVSRDRYLDHEYEKYSNDDLLEEIYLNVIFPLEDELMRDWGGYWQRGFRPMTFN
jgi:hypothetical protein